ncbi:MAG TPA: hypothetical protein VFH95_00945, partial [Candidatus Kapabacteria bacterium]|nr:hypothetical protein [Candidatus Kapabacteria bacterium]
KGDRNDHTAWGEAIDAVAGDGCAIYVQRTSNDSEVSSAPLGCLRSTDDGQTWVDVGGPVHDCDARTLAVTGHGAVVYAMADSTPGSGCHLWKTTDGGDGTLSSQVPISVTMGHTLGANASGGDTLAVKLCDTASFALWLQFVASCDYGGLTGVTIDGIDSSAGYTVTCTHHPWSALEPDTAAVTIIPLKPGIYPLTVHAHYTDDDFLGGDTTFPMTLVVKPNPGVVVLDSKRLYDFGAMALCNPIAVVDSIPVSGHGCEQAKVDSMLFFPDSANFTDFTFSPVRNFVPTDSATYFPISFKPSIAATERGSVLIFWNDGETEHTDTIRVQGAGVWIRGAFPSIRPRSR